MKLILSMCLLISHLVFSQSSNTTTTNNAKDIIARAQIAAEDFISERWSKYVKIENKRKSYFQGFRREMNSEPSMIRRAEVAYRAQREGALRANSTLNSIDFNDEVNDVAYSNVKLQFLQATDSGRGVIPELNTNISSINIPSHYNTGTYIPLESQYTFTEAIFSDKSFNRFFNAKAISIEELTKNYKNYLDKFTASLSLTKYLSTSRNYYNSLDEEGRDIFKKAFKNKARVDLDYRRRNHYYRPNRRAREHGEEIAIDYYQVKKLNILAQDEFNLSLRENFDDIYRRSYESAYAISSEKYYYSFRDNPVILLDESKISTRGTPAPGAKLDLYLLSGFIKNIGGVSLRTSTTNFSTTSNQLSTEVSSRENDSIEALSISEVLDLPRFLSISENISINDDQIFELKINLKGESRSGKLISKLASKPVVVSFASIVKHLLSGVVVDGEQKLSDVMISEFQVAIDSKKNVYIKDYKNLKAGPKSTANSRLGKLYLYFRDGANSNEKEGITRVLNIFKKSNVYKKRRYWLRSPTKYNTKKYATKYFELMNI